MDYDHVFVLDQIEKLTTPDVAYRPRRVPGSPTHEMTLGIAYKFLSSRGISLSASHLVFQWLTWLLSLFLLFLVQKLLLKYLSPVAAFFAACVLALHPLFIWHAWAFMEDMFGLFFVLAGWFLIREKKDYDLAAISMAVGCGAKALGLGFALAGLIYILAREGKYRAMRYALVSGVLLFFFYAPAFAWYGMSFKTMGTYVQHYGTNPLDRPAIGALLARDSVLFYIPVYGFLLWGYLRRFLKKDFRFFSFGDVWLLSLLPLCVMDFNKFGYRYIFYGATLISIFCLVKKLNEENSLDLICYWIMAGSVFFLAFRNPYSRSFFLFAIPPLLLVMAQKFKSKQFWVSVLVISFLPMFYYFQVRGKPPFFTLFPRGFYSAHIMAQDHARHNNEYNDGGLSVLTPILKIP